MDGIKVKGITCGAIDYKESDKLVTLLTVEMGKISVLVKGCRKANAKLRFAAAPFCFGEYVLAEKNGYYTLIGCTPIEQFVEISSDIDRFYAGSVILETLSRFTREGDNVAGAIVCVLNYLKIVAYEEYDLSTVLIAFLCEFMGVSGYELNFSQCQVCRTTNMTKRYFSFNHGGLVCGICAGQRCESISAPCVGLFRAILTKTPLGVLKFEDYVTREALVLLGEYVAFLLGRGLNSINQYLDISKSV